MAAAVTLGMLVPLFPEPRERARAIGAFSFVQAAGGSLGSLLGGVVTNAVSWPWIFYLNLPIGIVTVGLMLAVTPSSVSPRSACRRSYCSPGS